MQKLWLILKWCIYYIIGLISFSLIAYITQTIVISLLLNRPIYITQDIHNITNIISVYDSYYITIYTILYFLIFYSVRKYDKYIVNKLNNKFIQVKGELKNGKR